MKVRDWMLRRCRKMEIRIGGEVSSDQLFKTSYRLFRQHRSVVKKIRLQGRLAASACVWIALKFHCDTQFPVVYSAKRHQGCFKRRQLLAAERIVLHHVNWQINDS